MYISRLAFHSLPGKTHELEQGLQQLRDMVVKAGGAKPRVLRTHFASLGAPDIVFEQEAPDLAALESQIKQVTDTPEFRQWTQQISGLLAQSSKREVYQLID